MKTAVKIGSIVLLSTCMLVTSPLIAGSVVRSSPVIPAPAAEEPVSETEPPTEETTEPVTEPPTEPPPEPLAFSVGDESYFEDALLIGDSHIGQLRQYGTLHEADYLCGAGLTTQMLLDDEPMEGTTFSEKLASRSYGKIYLMVGFHETAEDKETFRSHLRRLADQIREAQPEAFLFLMANQYLTKTATLTDTLHDSASLRSLNAVMQSMEDGQTIFYLDSNPLYDDGYGFLSPDASSDGAHLRQELYPELCTWLCEHVIILPEPEEETPLTFGDVVNALRQGKQAARESWEDAVLVISGDAIQKQSGDSTAPWTPGQEDLLANDWRIVE